MEVVQVEDDRYKATEEEIWRACWDRDDTADALVKALVGVAALNDGVITGHHRREAHRYAVDCYDDCFSEELFTSLVDEAQALASANQAAWRERFDAQRARWRLEDEAFFQEMAKTEKRSVWTVRDVTEIFAALEPVKYLLEPLDICPGAPALFAGYGFSGKTIALQSMAVSIASGQPVWNCFKASRGRVLHIDYEQGFRLTRDRYQRLAAGMLVTPDELEGRLSVVPMPQVYLDDPKHEAFLTAAVEGYDMAIVDSLRACGPSIEENDSSVRGLLDMLNRVSDKTGCCFIVIHHARKPARDGASAGGAKMSIRGSGAIFDACASVVILEAEKGQPTKVTHEKARTSGITSDDFLLKVEDREANGNPRGGLVVLAESTPMAGTAAGSFDALKKRVLEELAKGPAASKTALAARVSGNMQSKYAAIAQLVEDGAIVENGKRLTLATH